MNTNPHHFPADQIAYHIELFSYSHSKIQQELLAHCESHGRWIEWMEDETKEAPV